MELVICIKVESNDDAKKGGGIATCKSLYTYTTIRLVIKF